MQDKNESRPKGPNLPPDTREFIAEYRREQEELNRLLQEAHPHWRLSYEEQRRWDEKERRSNDGVLDDLFCWAESESFMAHVAETILRLPDEVREFVSERCWFIAVGRASSGYARPNPYWMDKTPLEVPIERRAKKWVIVLHEDLPPGEEEGVIAHEIAHVWLGHDANDANLDMVRTETDAALLAREWGFTGRGTDPAYCISPDEGARLESTGGGYVLAERPVNPGDELELDTANAGWMVGRFEPLPTGPALLLELADEAELFTLLLPTSARLRWRPGGSSAG